MKTNPLIEYMVGKNEISLLNKSTIYFSIKGEIDKFNEELCLKNICKLLDIAKENNNIIIDLNGTGQEILKLKDIWKAMNEHEKVNTIALITENSGIKEALSFSSGDSKKKTISLFNTKEDAISHLK